MIFRASGNDKDLLKPRFLTLLQRNSAELPKAGILVSVATKLRNSIKKNKTIIRITLFQNLKPYNSNNLSADTPSKLVSSILEDLKYGNNILNT